MYVKFTSKVKVSCYTKEQPINRIARSALQSIGTKSQWLKKCIETSLIPDGRGDRNVDTTHRSTGLRTELMLPYDARHTKSRKTVSATTAGWSSSLGLSSSSLLGGGKVGGIRDT